MAELTFKSAGVSATEIDLTGPVNAGPVGTPAGVIGTANRGPAFVPITVGTQQDYDAVFGATDGEKFGPLAAAEWLRRATSLTYVRVLGVGKGEKRTTTGDNIGNVESAGFVVGEQQPLDSGNFGNNANAVENGHPGRTYFLGTFMSESAGSDVFSAAGIQTGTDASPIIRAVIFAASGVLPTLSSSITGSQAPDSSVAAISGTDAVVGFMTGAVTLLDGATAKQEFVMLFNGHRALDPSFPNVLTASFDVDAPNYFANVMNQDPLKMEEAGYLLYTRYDVHPALAATTGSGVAEATTNNFEEIAFLATGSRDRNLGAATIPNYENFEDRFATARTPWIISQKFGGLPQNLFKIHALSDGAFVNDKWKVSIENLAPSNSEESDFGKFDLVLRDIDDSDDDKIVIESYRGLSLDPSNERYVAKAIGDQSVFFDFDKSSASQKLVVDGQYENVSARIRVEIDSAVDNEEVDPTALPSGFRGHSHLVTSGSDPMADNTGGTLKSVVELPVPFRENIVLGVDPKKVVNKRLYWGVQFERKISLTEKNKSLSPNPTIKSMSKYMPNFMTTNLNMFAGDNAGVADVGGTVLDSDVFNNNIFSLEHIQVVTGSNTKADLKTVEDWTYQRAGSVAANETNKTRAFSIEDDLSILGVRTLAKFSFHLQGGFDGTNIFNKQETDLSNRAVFEEMNFIARGQDDGPTVKAYRKALDLMALTSEVDIQLLAIPGIRHSVISDAAVVAVENRFDAMYIMDIEERDLVNAVVTSSMQDQHVQNTVTSHLSRNLDTSFAAAYFPDIVVQDPTTLTNVIAPPSVGVLGAFALNDSVAFPWFAPAGFTRGILDSSTEAAVKLNRENMDDLYEADINPIVTFPGGPGLTIWGQKTLLAAQSALDRVNVRRLLLNLRRRVRRVANQILFEPNREDTLERFSALVNPILERVQSQSGVNRYKVQIDTSTTTQADVENNTIRGFIFIEPTRTAEFVKLDFVITNTGVEI